MANEQILSGGRRGDGDFNPLFLLHALISVS
jgi:hypothetical protein